MSSRLATLRAVAIAAGAIVAVAGTGTVAAVEVVAHQPPPKLTVAQVAAKVRFSVVSIKAAQFRGGVTEGQGFFFGNGSHVLTSARLLAHATHVDVIGPKGDSSPAALVGIDKLHDVAELLTYDSKSPALVAAPKTVATGARAMIVGNPYSQLPYTVHEGVVVSVGQQLVIKSQTFSDLLGTDVAVDPANVGGAVVNMSGQLVGLVEPDDSGHALVVPPVQFSSQVKTWTRSDLLIRLGPPLVTKDPPTLVLGGVSLGDIPQIKKEAWGSSGVHVVFERPANYEYGSVSVTIYLYVEADETTAHSTYTRLVSNSINYGFSEVGTTTSELGDEATALQRSDPKQVAYNVIWRDRNVSVDMYLSGGTTLSPDVSMDNLIGLVGDQEAAIAANLAGW